MRIVIEPTTIRIPLYARAGGQEHIIGHLALDLTTADVTLGSVPRPVPFHYDFAPGDTITQAGGWCAPTETLYDPGIEPFPSDDLNPQPDAE